MHLQRKTSALQTIAATLAAVCLAFSAGADASSTAGRLGTISLESACLLSSEGKGTGRGEDADGFFLDQAPADSGTMVIEGEVRPTPHSGPRASTEQLNQEAERLLSDDAKEAAQGGSSEKAPLRTEGFALAFSREQASFRDSVPQGQLVSAEAMESWSRFLGQVDETLKVSPMESDFFLLTSLSEALERELGLAEAHYAALPPWLSVAVKARAQGVDRKIHDRLDALAAAGARGGGKASGKASGKQGGGKKGHPATALWKWPIPHPVITSDFGVRTDPFTGGRRMHNGVDIRAREPERVEAIAAGTVTRSGLNGGHGISVEVLHEGGFTSVYSHLSLALLMAGDQVAQGDAVGISGDTGRSTGPHLHFELWKRERPVNPLDYLVDEPEFGCEEWKTEEGFWRSCGGGLAEEK